MITPATETQQRIFQLFAEGHTDNRVAKMLRISRRTVVRRVSEFTNPRGIKTRFQLAAYLANQK